MIWSDNQNRFFGRNLWIWSSIHRNLKLKISILPILSLSQNFCSLLLICLFWNPFQNLPWLNYFSFDCIGFLWFHFGILSIFELLLLFRRQDCGNIITKSWSLQTNKFAVNFSSFRVEIIDFKPNAFDQLGFQRFYNYFLFHIIMIITWNMSKNVILDCKFFELFPNL